MPDHTPPGMLSNRVPIAWLDPDAARAIRLAIRAYGKVAAAVGADNATVADLDRAEAALLAALGLAPEPPAAR